MRFALIPVQLRYEKFGAKMKSSEPLQKSVERKTIMSYITVQEAAKKWGISERLVRRYCAEGRIPDLAQYDGIWQIPEDADKPSRIKKDTVNTPQIPHFSKI